MNTRVAFATSGQARWRHSQLPPSLVDFAGRFGIATEYQDWSGRRIDVPANTFVAVLAALGLRSASDEAEGIAALIEYERVHWSL